MDCKPKPSTNTGSEHCCVPRCTNNKRYKPELSFHSFPEDKLLRKTWLIKIRRDENEKSSDPSKHFKVTRNTHVCSAHFVKDDFKYTPIRKTLKKGAVPSQFNWTVQNTRRILKRKIEDTTKYQDDREPSINVNSYVISKKSPFEENQPQKELNKKLKDELEEQKRILEERPIEIQDLLTTGFDGQSFADSACVILTGKQLRELVRNAVAGALKSQSGRNGLAKAPGWATLDSRSPGDGRDFGSTEGIKDFSSSKPVRDKTNSALRKEFYSMRQNPGQTFQQYETTLQRKAARCNFHVRCSNANCGQIVSYADRMVSDLLLVGSEHSRMNDKVSEREAHLATLQEKYDLIQGLEKGETVKRQFDQEQNADKTTQMPSETNTNKLCIIGLANDVTRIACGERQAWAPSGQMLVVRSNHGLSESRAETFTEKACHSPQGYIIKKMQEITHQGAIDLTPSLAHGQLSNGLTSREAFSDNQDQFSDRISWKNLTTGQDTKLHSENEYQCMICKLSCETSEELTKHMRTHSLEKPYECTECGMRFNERRALSVHMRSHRDMRTHTGEKPYKCSECGKSFTSSNAFTYHLRIHTGEKPFMCGECGKCFRSNSSLTAHKSMHTGENKQVCEVCGKCVRNTNSLTMHMRIHTGEKPYHCTMCEKSFSRHDYLDKHMFVHTGEKPFQCAKCGKCFTQRSNLKGHKCVGEKP